MRSMKTLSKLLLCPRSLASLTLWMDPSLTHFDLMTEGPWTPLWGQRPRHTGGAVSNIWAHCDHSSGEAGARHQEGRALWPPRPQGAWAGAPKDCQQPHQPEKLQARKARRPEEESAPERGAWPPEGLSQSSWWAPNRLSTRGREDKWQAAAADPGREKQNSASRQKQAPRSGRAPEFPREEPTRMARAPWNRTSSQSAWNQTLPTNAKPQGRRTCTQSVHTAHRSSSAFNPNQHRSNKQRGRGVDSQGPRCQSPDLILLGWPKTSFGFSRICYGQFQTNFFQINSCCCCSVACCVWLFATPWTAAHQASLSFTISQGLLKLRSAESVMPSNHLILCHPTILLF